MKKIPSILFICITVALFFWQFFIKGLFPIPADTIVGLYHPFRDLYAKDYPNGIPFKNFLITDPVRQQYPWRELVISAEKKLELPLWNSYSFAGTPLLANFQSASFYPLNMLFFLMPFAAAWNFLIILGPLFSGIFLYLYLDNLKLSRWASLLGAITFCFSGFSMSWLEWGTIMHAAVWLPLVLLSIDKIFLNLQGNSKLWYFIFIFSLLSSFFAGHLQIFFYLWIFSSVYFFVRWWRYGKRMSILVLYALLNALFLIFSSVQWIPTLRLIFLSARNIDLVGINNPGWFIPWQHLIQFIAPDFFGNPATLNYWGVWNYGELVGYVGIMPLIMALFAMFYRKDKRTLFFGTFFFISMIFSFPTFFAKIPYILKIPFLDTAQPTRLLFLIDFTLAVLSALGFDYLLKTKRRFSIIYPLIFISIILGFLWTFIPKEHLTVVKSNLYLPTLLFVFSSAVLIVFIFIQRKNKYAAIVCTAIVTVTVFDLLRFGWKFTPFTSKNYLFPSTKAIAFLQKNLEDYRIMTADSRMLPPNFSAVYKLQSVDGYDPLYLLRYGELIAASERGKADIAPPFGFNRIITPHNYKSRIIDLLGVKYVISLSALNFPKLTKVFQQGQTIIYENKAVMPRAFFVENIKLSKNKNESIKLLFDSSVDLIHTGIVENENENLNTAWSAGSVSIIHYSENEIIINTENKGVGFLVLTDTFYPSWKVSIGNNPARIYLTNYNFRGIVVPAGEHMVRFYNSLY